MPPVIYIILLTLFSLLANVSIFADASTTRHKTSEAAPNILFIPIDDLKPMLGCYGNETIQTPNIDRLATRGMVFMNNHCQQALCGPSRASIMTGLYPDTTGIYDFANRMREMNPEILTLPQYFRQYGYETTGLGKTYDSRCVDEYHDRPSWSIPYLTGNQLLHYSKGIHPSANEYQNPQTKKIYQAALEAYESQKNKPEGMAAFAFFKSYPGARPAYECYDVPDDAYNDGARTTRALERLKQLAASEKPFFLSVGYEKPHLPFVAPKKYWDLYDPKEINLATFTQMPAGSPAIGYQPGWEIRSMYSDVPSDLTFPDEYQRNLIHGYMASVSYIDTQVGRLLDQLDALGISENTIICLWGDHGWHLGDHNIWCKHSNFEQATRSPLIVADPRITTHGSANTSPTEFVDVFPTLCELAGLEIPSHLPGKSLAPIMNGAADQVKDFALSQFPRTPEGRVYMGYALRDDRYRYIAWYKVTDDTAYKSSKRDFGMHSTPEFSELYDYETDPLEMHNLAIKPEHSERIKAYKQSIDQKIFEIQACLKKIR